MWGEITVTYRTESSVKHSMANSVVIGIWYDDGPKLSQWYGVCLEIISYASC